MSPFFLRPEQPGDAAAIAALTCDAFAQHPHSDNTEHHIIEQLRAAGALALSLVAVRDDALIGHIAFSPVQVSDGSTGWFGLGPLSVRPAYQGGGVGTALVTRGLAELKEVGAAGCVLLGPPAYYGRFGFLHHPALCFPGPPAELFQAISFGPPIPAGEVRYHPAFGG